MGGIRDRLGKRYAARPGEMVVTAARGGGRGAKCFPKAIPSNCEISDRAARFMLSRPQRIILDATSSDPRDLLDLNA